MERRCNDLFFITDLKKGIRGASVWPASMNTPTPVNILGVVISVFFRDGPTGSAWGDWAN